MVDQGRKDGPAGSLGLTTLRLVGLLTRFAGGTLTASLVADERTMLESWLDYHRATLLMKCADLSDDQRKLRSAEPSSLSSLGRVRHMTDVERGWFRRMPAGEDAPPLCYIETDRDGDFYNVDAADQSSPSQRSKSRILCTIERAGG